MTNLPTTLLPAGALDAMRNRAQEFMTTPVEVYALIIDYDKYGQQTTTSGLIVSTSGYFGGVKGSDRELLSQTMQAYTRRDGVRVKTDALVLMPFETTVSNDDVLRVNGDDWFVVWNNNATQDSVQIYTKCIVVQFAVKDERLNP